MLSFHHGGPLGPARHRVLKDGLPFELRSPSRGLVGHGRVLNGGVGVVGWGWFGRRGQREPQQGPSGHEAEETPEPLMRKVGVMHGPASLDDEMCRMK